MLQPWDCRKMSGAMQDLQGPVGVLAANGDFSLNDAQRLAHFPESVRSLEQLVALVRRANYGAQPCFAFCHGGIAHRRGEYACFKKLLRKLKCLGRVTHVNRKDGRLAALELESALLQFALEELRVGPQFFHQLLALR